MLLMFFRLVLIINSTYSMIKFRQKEFSKEIILNTKILDKKNGRNRYDQKMDRISDSKTLRELSRPGVLREEMKKMREELVKSIIKLRR